MKNRPETEVIEAVQAFDGATPIIPSHTDEWEQLAAHVDGAFVVLVETAYGRYRRRVWFTLAAAERAAEKARDAGHDSVVVLAEDAAA